MLVFEEAQKRIEEVGGFSKKLEEVLLYLLKETQDIRETVTKENEARKGEIEKKCKDLERSFQDDSNRLKEIIKKENEERQRDMKDIEAYVKKENAERKKESNQISEKIKSDEEKRKEEAKALEDKIAKEKKELEEYLKKDALEHKQKMESENKAIKDKLDRDSTELKKKISDADDEKAEEMKILQNRLDNERKMLNDKMEREKAEIAEELERAAAERKTEANKLKNQLEEDKKQQENGVVQMFERLKGENENRKSEIHGLKDILVRENERLQNDQIALGNKLDAGLGELDDRLVRETTDCRKEMKKGTDGIIETINTDKKELKDKLDNEYTDLKRKVELETNDLRDKMQFDKKAMVQKFEEVEDERQKEAKLIRAQLQKEREETKDTISNETKMIQNQMDDNIRDLLDVVKKEKNDREKDVDHVKKRIEEEKEELQQTINRDRDNMTKKLNEEHDQRRIEQLEVQQRLENTEKSGKNDMVELFNRVKRYEEEARIDNDEVRQAITRTASGLEERVLRDKKELRELLDHEAADLSKRVDKCNLERINDSADVQGKIGMLGKSASRHLEHLKHALQRETQNLIELAGKPGSVMFSAYRDEGHADGGECYVTFSGCNVNLGNGFLPKSGMFQCPEPGMYLFSVTVCTYDGKKCLLILRKNEKDICALIDQDGNENRGKTMISQTCFLELDVSDRVQVYAVTGTGYTDTKSSHYTQFSGVLLRASQETFKAASRSLTEDEDVSIGEGSFRGFTPMRGFTPGPNGDISRRNSRKEPRRNNENRDVNKAMSPTPIDENRPVQNGHGSPEEKPVRKEKKKIPDPMEIKEESPTETEQNIPSQKVNGTLVDIEAPKGEKPQQSYLALTGLGGPDKKAEAKPNQGTPMAGNTDPANPNNGFYSFLKR
eukprot:TRINITY_DN9958_c0_g1_i2.p1 TRINITY_DN9958_c0_g1~~TRINITY_DN9958_c0_g1_i2.p1  ORF type:complete len:899 (+),score=287.53 TRINITY_DN9958_c0_g1_i2:145-2841(+)